MRDLPFPGFQVGLAVMAVLVIILGASRQVPPVAQAAAPADGWAERGAAATKIAQTRPGDVSFAVVDAGGNLVASRNAENLVSAASTIKAMILAAYLRQPGVADRKLTSAEQASMTAMVTWSSNKDASRLLRKAGWSSMDALAAEAGMQGGYVPDHGSWGLTKITAASLAAYFHDLPALLPARHRDFALGLFGKVVAGQQWGMVSAAPVGWSWHVKGGWIDEAVNQIGTFTKDGEEFTVAVTIEAGPGTGAGVSADPAAVPAVNTIEQVTKALFGDGTIPDAPGAGPRACGSVAQVQSSTAATPTWATTSECQEATAVS